MAPSYIETHIRSSQSVTTPQPTKLAKAKAGVGGSKGMILSAGQHRPTPEMGTPEWEAEKAEEARQEKLLNNALKSICRGC